jgi:TolA-binding protein
VNLLRTALITGLVLPCAWSADAQGALEGLGRHLSDPVDYATALEGLANDQTAPADYRVAAIRSLAQPRLDPRFPAVSQELLLSLCQDEVSAVAAVAQTTVREQQIRSAGWLGAGGEDGAAARSLSGLEQTARTVTAPDTLNRASNDLGRSLLPRTTSEVEQWQRWQRETALQSPALIAHLDRLRAEILQQQAALGEYDIDTLLSVLATERVRVPVALAAAGALIERGRQGQDVPWDQMQAPLEAIAASKDAAQASAAQHALATIASARGATLAQLAADGGPNATSAAREAGKALAALRSPLPWPQLRAHIDTERQSVLRARQHAGTLSAAEVLNIVISDHETVSMQLGAAQVLLEVARSGQPMTWATLAPQIARWKSLKQPQQLAQASAISASIHRAEGATIPDTLTWLSSFPGSEKPAQQANSALAKLHSPLADRRYPDRIDGFLRSTIIGLRIQTHLEQGQALAQEHGQQDAARRSYLAIIRDFQGRPELEQALEALARTFLDAADQQQWSQGLEAFVSWTDTQSQDPEVREIARYFVVKLLYEAGNQAAALNAAHAFLTANGDSKRAPKIRLLIGVLLVEADRGNEGRTALQELSADPAMPPAIASQALFLEGWSYLFEMNQPEAKRILNEVVRRFPNSEHATKARELLERLP